MKKFLLIALSFLTIVTTSCQKDELEEMQSYSYAEKTAASNAFSSEGRNNLLAEAKFEPTLSSYFNKQIYTSFGFAINSDFVRSGSKAAKFEMRSSDSQIRSEILLPYETNSNRWYGNSLYLPSNAWENDYNPEGWDIISQWHAVEDAGEAARLPPLSLVVSKGRLNFVIYWATKSINTNTTISGKKVFDLGPLEKDKWLDMVYHFNFSHQSDGVLEVWKNGVKVVDYKGPNCYNDKNYPYFKTGIYKRRWYKVTKRVIYIDEVRAGNEKATYKDVVPSGAVTPPTTPPTDSTTVDKPTSNEPLTLTLINANTDQPLQKLTEGSTFDLATLPTYDLNIEATSASAVGSVKFNLSGTENQEMIQSGAPYSLFGDAGGNFNNWLPASGDYTLKATSFSGANATGNAVATASVSFKVVNSNAYGSGAPSVKLVINSDSASTSSTQARLNISAVNATHMRFYDNANSNWTDWEPVTEIKPWTLSSGAGSKWVKVQVLNTVGVMSEVVSDGIILQNPNIADLNANPSVAMVINNNAATTTTTNVTLNITALNATQMRFYDNANSTWTAWESIAATKAWTLSSGAGSKWVKVQVKNASGIMSTTVMDGINLENPIVSDPNATPTVKMVINNNAASTTSTKVTLNVTATNSTHIRFYDNANSNWTAWEAVKTTRAWTLSSGAGSKWVKAQTKNAAGKMSTSVSDGIILK
ncbi:polysaccharide lyase [Adhaeribacter radiodurans]|uniref:Heparin lyase I family protein n=1 Tax=Adhaeribacter radiodurans TaxID=2745197 RepID=A0A7L7L9L0_9BACT|nr:polysaccharide lyase [Adhaeribacter radiodurans]QMU29508.1 heparin lyase I family protein [Adhaeribacter radiodurans]